MKCRVLVNLWLILPGQANFVPTQHHWDRMLEIGKVWINRHYYHSLYPKIGIRKINTNEEEPCPEPENVDPEEPSTSSSVPSPTPAGKNIFLGLFRISVIYGFQSRNSYPKFFF